MNKRIKLLRISLNLSQEAFGEKLGIKSRAHISALELGRRTLTDRIISDICREFNVNEEWLREGVGEMFNEKKFSLDDYASSKGATDFDIELIKIYLDMPEDLKDRLKNLFIKNI